MTTHSKWKTYIVALFVSQWAKCSSIQIQNNVQTLAVQWCKEKEETVSFVLWLPVEWTMEKFKWKKYLKYYVTKSTTLNRLQFTGIVHHQFRFHFSLLLSLIVKINFIKFTCSFFFFFSIFVSFSISFWKKLCLLALILDWYRQ